MFSSDVRSAVAKRSVRVAGGRRGKRSAAAVRVVRAVGSRCCYWLAFVAVAGVVVVAAAVYFVRYCLLIYSTFLYRKRKRRTSRSGAPADLSTDLREGLSARVRRAPDATRPFVRRLAKTKRFVHRAAVAAAAAADCTIQNFVTRYLVAPTVRSSAIFDIRVAK